MYPYVHLPLINMRETPTTQSKVVSQTFFGECVEIQERRGDWVLISTPDHYLGWIPQEGLFFRSEPYEAHLEVSRLSAHLYGAPDTEFGPLLTLPYGSKLHLLNTADPRWFLVRLPNEQEAFLQKGDTEQEPFDLVAFSKKFLHLPYTWGGRTSFGFDCSGYIQMLYQRLGISLPRDARQQMADPRAVPIVIEDLRLGDLIFWGHSAGEIKHVGMFLGEDSFIHTSVRENRPYLRISRLSDPEWAANPTSFYPYRTARTFQNTHFF